MLQWVHGLYFWVLEAVSYNRVHENVEDTSFNMNRPPYAPVRHYPRTLKHPTTESQTRLAVKHRLDLHQQTTVLDSGCLRELG